MTTTIILCAAAFALGYDASARRSRGESWRQVACGWMHRACGCIASCARFVRDTFLTMVNNARKHAENGDDGRGSCSQA